jgi:hypothetical protein
MKRLERYRKLVEYGCVACKIELGRYHMPEIHHIVDKGYRKHSGGDAATLPLCEWHHRGVHLMPNSTDGDMTETYGPSLAHSKKGFQMRFGTERELLALVNKEIL